MKGFSVVLLSVAFGCFVIIAVSSNIMPFTGPRMCKRICQQTTGCFSVKFSAVYLSCKLPFQNLSASDDTFLNFTLEKDKDDVPELNTSCPLSAKRFVSRNHLFLCRVPDRVWSSKDQKSELTIQTTMPMLKQVDNMPRVIQINNKRSSEDQKSWSTVQAALLVFETQRSESIMKQIFLNNGTVKTLKLSCGKINSIHVIETGEVISVCGSNQQLHIDHIEGPDFNVKGKGYDNNVKYPAVADNRIFYTRFKALKQITMEEKTHTVIKKLDFYPKHLVSDLKRLVLYVTDDYNMKTLNYDGEVIVVHIKRLQGPMLLNSHKDILYIAPRKRKGCIYAMTLTDNTVNELACYPKVKRITSLFGFNDNVYSTTRRCEALFLEHDRQGKINFEKQYDHWFACNGGLIPLSAYDSG